MSNRASSISNSIKVLKRRKMISFQLIMISKFVNNAKKYPISNCVKWKKEEENLSMFINWLVFFSPFFHFFCFGKQRKKKKSFVTFKKLMLRFNSPHNQFMSLLCRTSWMNLNLYLFVSLNTNLLFPLQLSFFRRLDESIYMKIKVLSMRFD